MKNNNELIAFIFDANNILNTNFNGIIKEDFNAEIVDDKGRTPLMFFLQILIEDMEKFTYFEDKARFMEVEDNIGLKYNKNILVERRGILQTINRLGFLISKSSSVLQNKDSDGRSLLSYVIKLRLLLARNSIQYDENLSRNLYPKLNIVSIDKQLGILQKDVSSNKTDRDTEILNDLITNARNEDIIKIGLLELVNVIDKENSEKIFASKENIIRNYESTLSRLYNPIAKNSAKNWLKETIINENFEKLKLFWKKLKLDKDSWVKNIDSIKKDELSKLKHNLNIEFASKVAISFFGAALITAIVCLASVPIKGLLLASTITSLLVFPILITVAAFFLYDSFHWIKQDNMRIAKVQEISDKVNSADLNENISYEQYEVSNGSTNSDNKYQDISLNGGK